jgi:hypothetical protein
MCTLDDNTTVNSMARHVRRVADGFVDIYVRIPQHATDDSSDDEENGGVHQEIAEEEFANEEQNYGVHHVQHGVEQPHVHHGVEQPQLQHGVEQPQVQHGVEQPQMQHGVEQPQVQHELTIEFVEKIIEPENVLQRKMMKLPIVRPPMHDKGKESVQNIAPEQEDFEETSDSDYDAVHEADSEDSSADDEEAICYRKQALELKKRVKRKMPRTKLLPSGKILPISKFLLSSMRLPCTKFLLIQEVNQQIKGKRKWLEHLNCRLLNLLLFQQVKQILMECILQELKQFQCLRL